MSRVGKAIGNALVTAAGAVGGGAVGRGIGEVTAPHTYAKVAEHLVKTGMHTQEWVGDYVLSNPDVVHAASNAGLTTGLILGGAAALGHHLSKKNRNLGRQF